MRLNPHANRDMFIGFVAITILAVLLGWGYLEEKKHAYDRGYNEGQEYVYGLWATWVMRQPGIQRIIFETDASLVLDSIWWAKWHQVNREAGQHPIKTLILKWMYDQPHPEAEWLPPESLYLSDPKLIVDTL